MADNFLHHYTYTAKHTECMGSQIGNLGYFQHESHRRRQTFNSRQQTVHRQEKTFFEGKFQNFCFPLVFICLYLYSLSHFYFHYNVWISVEKIELGQKFICMEQNHFNSHPNICQIQISRACKSLEMYSEPCL